MFRSSTMIRKLALNLAKVIFTLKHSVKLRHYLLCGCVATCCHTTVECFGAKTNLPLCLMKNHAVDAYREGGLEV